MASLTEAPVATAREWGGQSMSAPLRRVMVRRPAAPATGAEYGDFGYPAPVDHDRAEREHEAFRALLTDAGVEVIDAGPDAAGGTARSAAGPQWPDPGFADAGPRS